MPLVKVDVTVRAPGVVRPSTERTELRAAVSGRIARVLAKDNEPVAAGQVLLELSSRDVDERIARNFVLQKEQEDMIADLKVLIDAAGGDGAARPEPHFQTAAMQQELARFHTQLEANRIAAAKAAKDAGRISALGGKGLVSQSDIDASGFEVERLRAERAVLLKQSLSGWQSRLRDEEIILEQRRSEAQRLQEEKSYLVVRAPVAGALQGFIGLAEGAHVMEGQSFGAVSPSDELLVETFVSPRDVGLIRTGQLARLQVDAFPYTQWGLVNARVVQIAEDASVNGQQLLFRVLLRPERLSLQLPNGVTGTLRKGMTLNARYIVNRRSLFQALFEKTADWMNPQHGGSDGG